MEIVALRYTVVNGGACATDRATSPIIMGNTGILNVSQLRLT